MKNAQMEVIGRLNRVRSIPKDADRPIVQLGGNGGGNANQSLSWFFVQLLPGTAGPIDQYRHFIENTVKPRIEGVPGVSQVIVNAGPPDEVQITVDPAKAASFGVSIPDIAAQSRQRCRIYRADRSKSAVSNTNCATRAATNPPISAISFCHGKTAGPCDLGDVADIKLQPPKRQFYAYQNGNPAIGLDVRKSDGANVLATLNEVKKVVAELRDGTLKTKGLGIEQSFDSALFINRAVSLLTENLIVGALLSLICVWWFMRDWRATLLIASAIPICLLATFCVLHMTGHSLNVISLAGLAFAVGMVVEGAIVVSGNILRLKESGMTPHEAASKGTQQVVGALIASTITTVAVFLPVVFLKDVEGQIFADLALTISIAVAISVIVAITVLPAASGWLKAKKLKSGFGDGWPWLTDKIMSLTDTRPKQLGWIAALLVLPLALTFAFKPRLDYLPPVKRAAIDAYFNFPPGMAPDVVDKEIVPKILARMKPYMDGSKQPQLKNWYVLLWPGGGTIGARVVDESRIADLEKLVRDQVAVDFPDTRVFVEEGNLFGGFGGSARSVSIHLQGEDSTKLYKVAEAGRQLLEKKFPGANVQAFPPTDAAQLELHAQPNDRRIAEAGWDRATLGSIVQTHGRRRLARRIFRRRTARADHPARIRRRHARATRANPDDDAERPHHAARRYGQLETVLGPTQIRRLDHRRTVTLTMDPPATLALEDALKTIDNDVVPDAAPATSRRHRPPRRQRRSTRSHRRHHRHQLHPRAVRAVAADGRDVQIAAPRHGDRAHRAARA